MRTVRNENTEGDMLAMFVDALAGHGDGQIERQEKRGQQSFVKSDTLPKDGLDRAALEAVGVKIHDDADDLFVFVTLPERWRKVPTDHSMWSKLVDEKGRERASIFYKAAFYDRNAHMSLSRRYGLEVAPVSGWVGNYKDSEWHCIVKDGGTVIWQSAPLRKEPEYRGEHDEVKRQAWLDWQEEKDALGKVGGAWLDTNYPDWRNPNAYWGDE